MKVGRTLPPASAPIPLADVMRAIPYSLGMTSANRNFERELQNYFGSGYCFLVSSGQAALALVLEALKQVYPSKQTVIVPAFTCYSVPASVKRAGLKIKICDMEPDSLDIDRQYLKQILNEDEVSNDILCVVVTHLFGSPANCTEIQKIIGSSVPIIEDAAQAMGEGQGGKYLGTMGAAGFFSLGRGKALSVVEGGVVLTSRDDLGERISKLIEAIPPYSRAQSFKLAIKTLFTNILQNPAIYWLPKSLPFLRLGETIYQPDFEIRKISFLQRKLASKWDRRLEKHRKARISNIQFWLDRLPAAYQKIFNEQHAESMIRLPLLARSHRERNKLVSRGHLAGLGIMPGYPSPIHEIPEIAFEFTGMSYPRAKDICSRIFTIPVHELIKKEDNMKILAVLEEIAEA